MKKIFLTAAIIAFFAFSITTSAKVSGEDSIYPQTFIVCGIDKQTDTIHLRTFSGMVYAWKGVEDWQINDIAAAIMYNNGTPDTITDDQIAVLEYTGWLD